MCLYVPFNIFHRLVDACDVCMSNKYNNCVSVSPCCCVDVWQPYHVI